MNNCELIADIIFSAQLNIVVSIMNIVNACLLIYAALQLHKARRPQDPWQ